MNTFESILMRWMKLEPIIQSEKFRFCRKGDSWKDRAKKKPIILKTFMNWLFYSPNFWLSCQGLNSSLLCKSTLHSVQVFRTSFLPEFLSSPRASAAPRSSASSPCGWFMPWYWPFLTAPSLTLHIIIQLNQMQPPHELIPDSLNRRRFSLSSEPPKCFMVRLFWPPLCLSFTYRAGS